MKHKAVKEKKKVIWIGGVPYYTKAELNGWQIEIVGYDINTERHLIVNTVFDKNKRIELDNERLILTECKNPSKP